MHQTLEWAVPYLYLPAGGFYLLNKIFLSIAERMESRGEETTAREWRIASWEAYLLGLPPWIVIFAHLHYWIALGVEAAGAPAMFLGLFLAKRGDKSEPPKWLKRLALICIPLGIGYSVYDFGGITTLNQWLEIGLAAGFLIGTYLIARKRPSGYLWYVPMHICGGALMLIKNHPWLFLQQIASLAFIVSAYYMSRKRRNTQ